MRFLRHLAAAALIVAAVVVLGLAWGHFAPGTLAGGLQPPGGRQVMAGQQVKGPPREVAPGRGGPHGPGVIRAGGMNLGLGSMLDPANLPDLRHTLVIEAALMTVVMIIDAGRRRSRRAARAGRLGGSGALGQGATPERTAQPPLDDENADGDQ